MAALARQHIATVVKHLVLKLWTGAPLRCITTSSVRDLNQKWRRERGLPMNPNAHGVLTDLPDYSFLDGRPTPYGVRQKKRLVKQKELAETIIQLNGEIDFAIARHKQLQIEEEEQRRQILENKLKPKGLLLLKQK